MTLNEILQSIGNRTVTWKQLTKKLTDSGWESESAIRHLLNSGNLVKIEKGLYVVGERFKINHGINKPEYKFEEVPPTGSLRQSQETKTKYDFEPIQKAISDTYKLVNKMVDTAKEMRLNREQQKLTLEAAIELCRSHGIDCSRVTSVNHGNVRVVTRVIL